MRRLQLGMTALALSLMGLFLLRYVDREGKPVVVYLAPQAAGNTWYPYSFLAPIPQNEPGLTSALGVLDGLIAISGVRVDVQVAPELLRPVDQPLLLGTRDKIGAAIGWAPEIPLETTLRDLLGEWAARA